MIRLIIEVDDHPSWAECTKEAVAERLSDLGGVNVVDVDPGDKPCQQVLEDFRPKGWKDACPQCGQRTMRVRGPEGTAVERDIKPWPIWPDPNGPDWAQDINDEWVRVRLDGDRSEPHTVGFPVHKCKKEVG